MEPALLPRFIFPNFHPIVSSVNPSIHILYTKSFPPLLHCACSKRFHNISYFGSVQKQNIASVYINDLSPSFSEFPSPISAYHISILNKFLKILRYIILSILQGRSPLHHPLVSSFWRTKG